MKAFKGTCSRKAAGPDGYSVLLLKYFADKLAPAWQPIFQSSVDVDYVPILWKLSYISQYSKPHNLKNIRLVVLYS